MEPDHLRYFQAANCFRNALLLKRDLNSHHVKVSFKCLITPCHTQKLSRGHVNRFIYLESALAFSPPLFRVPAISFPIAVLRPWRRFRILISLLSMVNLNCNAICKRNFLHDHSPLLQGLLDQQCFIWAVCPSLLSAPEQGVRFSSQ